MANGDCGRQLSDDLWKKKVTMEIYGPNHYQFMDWIDNGLQSLYDAEGNILESWSSCHMHNNGSI